MRIFFQTSRTFIQAFSHRSLTEAVLDNIGPSPALRLLLDAFFSTKYTQPSMLFGHHFRPIFVLLLSQWFISGDSVFNVHPRQCTMQCAYSQGNSG